MAPVKRPRPKTWKSYVDGRWTSSRRLWEVRSPWDGSLAGRVCDVTPGQMEAAIAAADRAFRTHRLQPAYERAALLARIAQGLRQRREDLARLITAESGKPVTFARAEVDRAFDTFTIASEEAKRQGGELLPMEISSAGRGCWGIVKRFPLGAVAGISPFNFPLNLVAHKVAPALACGNTIVLRPAHQTPLAALALAGICHAAGAPPGTVNVVPCDRETAQPLMRDPRLRKLTFTGSPSVGWALKAMANTRRVTLELGSNSACIVDADADLDAAIPKIALGAFASAGQSCISVQRIFVHRRIAAVFTRRLVRHTVTEMKAGNPWDPATVCGPVIDAASAARVMSWIAEAKRAGAKLLCGGTRRGQVIAPTLLAGVPPSLPVSCQEVFGPVAVIETWDDFDDVLRRVNDSAYGLQAGVFTRDLHRAAQAFRDLEVGGVVVNNTPTFRVDHQPYGGEKDSGLGREGIRWAIEEMTTVRILSLNTGP